MQLLKEVSGTGLDGLKLSKMKERFRAKANVVMSVLRLAYGKKHKYCITGRSNFGFTGSPGDITCADPVIWKSYLLQLQREAPKAKRLSCSHDTPNKPPHYGREFHGPMDREDAEKLLSRTPEGSFLVRESVRAPGQYSLSFVFDRSIKHYRLYFDGEHYVGEKRFPTVQDLVADGLIAMYIEKKGSWYIETMAENVKYDECPYMTINQSKKQMRYRSTRRRMKEKKPPIPARKPNRLPPPVLEADENAALIIDGIIHQYDEPEFQQQPPPVAPHAVPSTPHPLPPPPPQIPSHNPPPVPPAHNVPLPKSPTVPSPIPPVVPPSRSRPQPTQFSSLGDFNDINDLPDPSADLMSAPDNTAVTSFSESPEEQDETDLPNAQDFEKSHAFKVHNFMGLPWCDYCGNFMWGLLAQGVKCEDCGFSAHNKCSEKVPNDCIPDLKFVKRVFGVDLTTLCKLYNTPRPFVLELCIKEIELRGMQMEGLYRVSGYADDIEALRTSFEKDMDQAQLGIKVYEDINVVSGCLKLYFRLLPIPLITYDTYPIFVNAARRLEFDDQIDGLKQAVRSLPAAHYQSLKQLIQHLYRVTEHEKRNLMTAKNLSTVFAPTLMRSPDTIGMDQMAALQNEATVIEMLIVNHKTIFDF